MSDLPRSTNQKKRDYCFTINNPTDADVANLADLEKSTSLRYLIIGEEVGEEGTRHYQGYVYFHNAIAFSGLKRYLPRAHIEPCMGTPEQNITYCKKEGKFREFGSPPISNKRKGELGREYWERNLQAAKKGKIEECDPKLQITHFGTLQAIASRYAPLPPDLPSGCDARWYYGPTGTGKSHKARTENPGAYLKMCNRWWNNYLGEDVVIIEDFDKKHDVLCHHLKIWADKYAFPAEIKHYTINLRPKTIIVTSNWHPNQIWQDPESLEPILRRFKISHFSIPFQINRTPSP